MSVSPPIMARRRRYCPTRRGASILNPFRPSSIGRGLMRPQAAVDGRAIAPWHLAAMLGGHLRIDPRAIAEPTEHRAFRVGHRSACYCNSHTGHWELHLDARF